MNTNVQKGKSSSGKYVFFDIDGTIWDRERRIPESTREAVAELRAGGGRAFINTGRSRSNIHDERLESLGFDGIVAACGNHIEMDGKILYERLMSPELIGKIRQVLGEQHMPIVFEGPDFTYFDPEDFPNDPYAQVLWGSLGIYARHMSDLTPSSRINKLTADITEKTDFEAVKRQLGDELEFIDHNGIVVEMILKGTTKAGGIKELQQRLGIADEDVYAVGDGMNDYDMIRSVRHGIAMGSGNPNLFPVAEYVTDRLENDGIAKALRHYGLIGKDNR